MKLIAKDTTAIIKGIEKSAKIMVYPLAEMVFLTAPILGLFIAIRVMGLAMLRAACAPVVVVETE